MTNSSHSWSNVLGLMSWLVDLFSLQTGLKFSFEDDGNEDLMDPDKVENLLDYTVQKYKEWSSGEVDSPLSSQEENKYFDELILGDERALQDNLTELEREVVDLTRQTEGQEDCIAEQHLTVVKADIENNTSLINSLKEKINNRQIAIEKKKMELQTMSNENDLLKQSIGDHTCSSSFNEDDIANIQSEVVSLRNSIKLQNTLIADINNQCYSLDLVNARLQGQVDEIRLQREAILRECTSEYINPNEHKLTLTYGNEDNSRILAEYLSRVVDTKLLLDNISKECTVKEKLNKSQKQKAEDDIKLVEATIFNMKAELKNLDAKLPEIKSKSAGLESQMKDKKEQLSELMGRQISSQVTLDSHRNRLAELEEEFKGLDNEFIGRREKYSTSINCMKDALMAHAAKCEELVKAFV